MYVFAYGSLMSPESLASTLPGVPAKSCVPARCSGFRRCFDVAFPNDGSQKDKAYFDDVGSRPSSVLFANLRSVEREQVNGVCVPVDAHALRILEARELRYDRYDITAGMQDHRTGEAIPGPVFAFLGKARFTQPDRVATGVVPTAYLAWIEHGARYWDRLCPGFLSAFLASTDLPRSTTNLRRVDLR